MTGAGLFRAFGHVTQNQKGRRPRARRPARFAARVVSISAPMGAHSGTVKLRLT